MSCYACTRKYGLFCKESGCGNCGYSFCLKCLKNEIEVPRHNNQKEKVCLRCYEKLMVAARLAKEAAIQDAANNPTKTKLEPNEIFQVTDPLESLEPILQPIPVNATPSSSSIDTNSDEITGNLDSEILKRLHGLKAGDALPGDDELRSRLCNLQGFQPKEYSKKDILLSTDQRTEQERINDLLKQFVEETDIDANAQGIEDPISEIERRLAALRDADPNEPKKKAVADPNTPSDNEEDDETLLKNIIQRYVDESRLPASSNDPGSLSSELASSLPINTNTEATEELPWCTICNEDAVVRCKGCGGDLFCRSCFKECHQDDEEWRMHETQTYSKPPTFKEDHF